MSPAPKPKKRKQPPLIPAPVADHAAFKQLAVDVRSMGRMADLTFEELMGAIIRMVDAAGVEVAVQIVKSPEELGRKLLRIASDVADSDNMVRGNRDRNPASDNQPGGKAQDASRGRGRPSVPKSEPPGRRPAPAGSDRSAQPQGMSGGAAFRNVPTVKTSQSGRNGSSRGGGPGRT